MSTRFCFLILIFCARLFSAEQPNLCNRIDLLIQSAENGDSLELETYQQVSSASLWSTNQLNCARKQLLRADVRKRYLLYFLLKSKSPCKVSSLGADVRGRILISMLANQTYMNDWGILTPEESFDHLAAKELIALGPTVLKYLIPLLRDKRDAFLFGSESATTSRDFGYRRCDFAYRYAILLSGQTPVFKATPSERDKDIAAFLKKVQDSQ